MAALARLSKTAFRLNNGVLKAGNGALVASNGVLVPRAVRVVGISTSKKNKDTVTVTDAVVEQLKVKTEETTVTKISELDQLGLQLRLGSGRQHSNASHVLLRCNSVYGDYRIRLGLPARFQNDRLGTA
ncbi:hypothetical protein OTU49_012727 [Cherax quadricarinatus]|uniref:Uncharacterized protein n=1 Tax=Cherax quadricarinatus TaxID=27406 RepID=A0AAW0VVU3_CHEQU